MFNKDIGISGAWDSTYCTTVMTNQVLKNVIIQYFKGGSKKK